MTSLPHIDLETAMTLMPRDVARRGWATRHRILRVRSYQARSGRVVDLGARVTLAVVRKPGHRSRTECRFVRACGTLLATAGPRAAPVLHGEKDSGREDLANDLGCHGCLGCWLWRETMSFAANRTMKGTRHACQSCRTRKARFSYRGSVRADRDHTLCFECYRHERERQRARRLAEVPAARPLWTPEFIPTVGNTLGDRQVAHRRAMLEHLGSRPSGAGAG